MRTILAPVEPQEGARDTVGLAALTATMFGSIIEGLALRAPPPPASDWSMVAGVSIETVAEDAVRLRSEAKALFEQVMQQHGIEAGPRDGEGASWRWEDAMLAGDETLGLYGRAFDLTVVGQPRSGTGAISTLEAALFESGGPILIAPRRPVEHYGQSAAIVWNGSIETARTIAFAYPMLRRAERVVVLADDGRLNHRPSGEMIRRRLERNGIGAELVLMSDGRVRSGDAVLGEANAIACDLLVKGAYTQSRLRQMIFGGATRHILENADVPVLMAH